ncbi:MAG: tRNA-dihydrouridine synthase [Candidatus Lloydbacteria bacterium CG22_combo_CG10-13_8_21_14_all_47_15]|uniref:tRNA-dihydrouridine synthase n=1 Tax=Candidatus Lloydbacteria bacterium CG22_combo_CG10-13_8_21_14_all_47_15 TaxID=1974635 RepID=A0A2H0CUL5_9BACT|nr:MAG: tRNA-dihydrouridine synthase [Candidatus Lloydbacteria bacterium CG22_combo_CG10-13_8_21_14_all_47_15]
MTQGFWKKLKKPFFALAPMADVTDFAFRQIIVKYGKPDVFWTEFVSADGLGHPDAREKLLVDLKYSEKERPIVAQIFGARPENIRHAAALAAELRFDGVDLNMGCPDRSVEKQCAGAALIKNPKLAADIIRAAQDGAPNLPISVKTRIGYNKDETDTWIPALLQTGIAALTVHARTRKEMSDVPAHWDAVARAVTLAEGTGIIIIGNGDVSDIKDAEDKAQMTGADGIMFGRAIFGNPWLFNRAKQSVSKEEKLLALVEHTKLFETELGAYKNFAIMKKHYKAYVSGWDGAKELRSQLMDAEDALGVETIINKYLTRNVKRVSFE